MLVELGCWYVVRRLRTCLKASQSADRLHAALRKDPNLIADLQKVEFTNLLTAVVSFSMLILQFAVVQSVLERLWPDWHGWTCLLLYLARCTSIVVLVTPEPMLPALNAARP